MDQFDKQVTKWIPVNTANDIYCILWDITEEEFSTVCKYMGKQGIQKETLSVSILETYKKNYAKILIHEILVK